MVLSAIVHVVSLEADQGFLTCNLLQAEMDLLNFAGIQDNEVQIKDTQLLDDP